MAEGIWRLNLTLLEEDKQNQENFVFEAYDFLRAADENLKACNGKEW